MHTHPFAFLTSPVLEPLLEVYLDSHRKNLTVITSVLVSNCTPDLVGAALKVVFTMSSQLPVLHHKAFKILQLSMAIDL